MTAMVQDASLLFTPATDALGHTAPLNYCAAFPVLGVPLEVRSNSPAVLAAAERAFGGWRGLAPELIEPGPPCVVSLVVHAEQRGTTLRRRSGQVNDEQGTMQGEWPAPFALRMHGDCFLASDGVNILTAQRDRGIALGFVTPELAGDEARLRHYALELLALALAAPRDRLPVHAGAVVRNGRAALLVGHSMAGKSTLCYACLRGGFGLLAEDVVYVSRVHGLRLWGVPWRIHLLPDAKQRFPELADLPLVRLPNGKCKLAVETAAFGPDRARRYVERACVCLVERHGGAASALEPIDPALAVAALTSDLEDGFDLYTDTRAVAEALADGGAYRLIVGNCLDKAVALLTELTENR